MGAITAKLYDLDSNMLADISEISLEKSMSRILNGTRAFTINSFANHSLFTTVADDGYRNLRKGNRKLVVWEDGITAPIFHGRVFGVERKGTGGTKTPVAITAYDQWMELGYDSENRAGRVVRDDTGNFINPTFAGTGTGGAGVISGPDLVKQILTNSQGTDAESGAQPGEGPLPIDLTGTFDVDVPPALDLSPVDSMDWPVLVGDFFQMLVQTGVVDIDMAPLEPGTGINLAAAADNLIMVALTALTRFGSDKSATVHFDYGTGSKNAKAFRHLEDFSTICNKLYDYLGPRIDQTHWKGNITPGSPGTTINPAASRLLYGGQFFSLREFDSIGGENSSRPLYLASWNGEQGYRVEPRDLLYITPAAGDKALFDALSDFDVGDDVGINLGGAAGIDLADSQRVYGFTKTWSRQNVASVSELLTSAEVALS
jgi:hypothetical protein